MVLDAVQIVTLILSTIGAVRWVVILRRWPITISVVIALLLNAVFYLAVSFDVLPRSDQNLISSVRVLIMVLIFVALPSTLRDRVL